MTTKKFELTVEIGAINRVKAKEVLKIMLKALDSKNIWYNSLIDIKEV